MDDSLPDPRTAAELMERYRSAVRRFLGRRVHDRAEVEDLTQQVFERLLKRAALTSIAAVQGYLFQIAAGLLVERNRTVARRASVVQVGVSREVADRADLIQEWKPELSLLDKEACTRLVIGLWELPARARAVFVLSRFEDLRAKEIAARLGVPVSTVEQDLHRADRHIRDSTADASVQSVVELGDMPDIAAMREAALTMASAPRASAGGWPAVWVALGGIVLIAGLWPMRTATQRRDQFLSTALQPSPTVFSTQKGHRRVVLLDDGSTITLDTATTVQTVFTAKRRDVTILQGQAYFRVAKDEHRPFVVLAADRRITAVGTAFDVRIDRGRLRLALVEGRLAIEPVQPTGLAWLFPSLGRLMLDAGKEFGSSSDGTVSVTTADVERVSRWQQDQIIFRDVRLDLAVREMNRYAATPILVDDPGIAGLRISGVFQTDRLDDFLTAVTTDYPLIVERRLSGSVRLARR